MAMGLTLSYMCNHIQLKLRLRIRIPIYTISFWLVDDALNMNYDQFIIEKFDNQHFWIFVN